MNNLGITISFVIGGLLIVAILTLNGRVIQNSGETVLNMSAKKTVQTVSQYMRFDFQRMGYNMDDSETDTIEAFTQNKMIEFWADPDTVTSTKAERITWKFTNKKVKNTTNPDDYKLVRLQNGDTTAQFAVTDFELKGFKANHSPTTNKSQIKSVFVHVETQSGESYGGGYSKSLWEKTFTPPNLQIHDVDW